MIEYITIFEIPSNWTDYFIVLSILCAVIGLSLAIVILIYILNNWKKWGKDKTLKKEAVFAFFFLFIWGIGWSFGTYAVAVNIRYGNEFIEAYYSDNYEIIEGVIEVLHQQPKSGNDSGDLIRINEKEIEFSYFSSTPAYHQTISNGGVLRDGVYAKIYLYKGKILRIDIPTTQENPNPDE